MSISDEVLQRIEKCQKCESLKPYKKFPSVAHGNRASRYILVSEAPGNRSLDTGKYWTGKSGGILRSSTNDFENGLESLFYLTDIVKCWPVGNRNPTNWEIAACKPFLFKEVQELHPDLIVSFGNVSSRTLLGLKIRVTKQHGTLHNTPYGKVLILIHPSRASQYYKYLKYKEELSELFKRLESGEIKNIESIFH